MSDEGSSMKFENTPLSDAEVSYHFKIGKLISFPATISSRILEIKSSLHMLSFKFVFIINTVGIIYLFLLKHVKLISIFELY